MERRNFFKLAGAAGTALALGKFVQAVDAQQADHKINICHIPPGNTDNGQLINIDINAWETGHGPGGEHKTHNLDFVASDANGDGQINDADCRPISPATPTPEGSPSAQPDPSETNIVTKTPTPGYTGTQRPDSSGTPTPIVDSSPTPPYEGTVYEGNDTETPMPIRRTPAQSGAVDQSQGSLGLKEIAAGTVLAGLGWVINRRMAAARGKSR